MSLRSWRRGGPDLLHVAESRRQRVRRLARHRNCRPCTGCRRPWIERPGLSAPSGGSRDAARPCGANRTVSTESYGEVGKLADWYLAYAGLRYGGSITPNELWSFIVFPETAGTR